MITAPKVLQYVVRTLESCVPCQRTCASALDLSFSAHNFTIHKDKTLYIFYLSSLYFVISLHLGPKIILRTQNYACEKRIIAFEYLFSYIYM